MYSWVMHEKAVVCDFIIMQFCYSVLVSTVNSSTTTSPPEDITGDITTGM